MLSLAGATPLLAAPWDAQGQPPVVRQFDRGAFVLRGPGSHIGASIRDLDAADAERQKVPGGVVIEEVTDGSPAAAAGLRTADIVVEFDGERVRSAQQFSRLVQETPPGRTVQAVVIREGNRTSVPITPQAGRGGNIWFDGDRIREDVERAMGSLRGLGIDPRGFRANIGVRVQELTPDLAAYFGAKGGVLVASVNTDSPASRAGLRAGDVITAINGAAVESAAELQRAIGSADGAQELTVTIVRDKKESKVAVVLDAPAREWQTRPLRPVRGTGV
jgi:serine protease Do